MAYRDMNFDRKTAKVARYYDQVKDGKRGVPISLQVSLCDQCFNRCIMCGHPERPVMHKMIANNWIEKLRTFAARGVESVCYSGGDAMAYSDFNDIMREHILLDVEFGMITTGYVPPTINLEYLSHAKWVRVSLDAVTPEVYAKVRGGVSVQKVLHSIEAMLAAKVNVALGITVHADNEADLPNVLSWATSHGITDIETHHIEPDSGPRAVKAIHWERKIEPFQNCHAALYQLYIDAAGDVYACCIHAGDAHDRPQAQPIGNIWRDSWIETIWPRTIEFSKLSYQELPAICRSCCVQRLSQINYICGQIETGKSFF